MVSIVFACAAGVGLFSAPRTTRGNILVVNTQFDHIPDGVCGTGTFINDCTLREAIIAANANADADTITFNLPNGFDTITVGSSNGSLADYQNQLPNITQPVTIDGTTGHSGWVGLDGLLLTTATTFNGLGINTTGAVTIKGLAITRFKGNGIQISGGAAGTESIVGNYIGTDVAGSAPTDSQHIFGNGANGILLITGTATIGGASAADRNVISNNAPNGGVNAGAGIRIIGGSANIYGNYIGLNPAGTAVRPNHDGIIDARPGAPATNVQIGSAALGAGSRNVISGNNNDGVQLVAAHPNTVVVEGNYIGPDAFGALSIDPLLLNNSVGVYVGNSGKMTVGGSTAAARNVISGNESAGVVLNTSGSASDSIAITGNYIGPDSGGALPSQHQGLGIQVANAGQQPVRIGGNSGITTGGSCTGECNLIAGNAKGVLVKYPDSISQITANSIYGNTGSLGIDLQLNDGTGAGVTPNDTGDPDVGPNSLQNFPILTSATGGSSTAVAGTLNSTASSTFHLEFFTNSACDDSSSNGEGQTYIGGLDVTTDSGGNASFGHTLAVASTPGNVLTATATNAANQTSEFSQCLTIAAGATPTPSPTLSPTLSPSPATTATPATTPTHTPAGQTPSPTPTPTTLHTPTPTPTNTPIGQTPSPTPTAAPVLKGDTNCDGDIDLDDVVALLRIESGLDSPCTHSAGFSTQTGDRDDVNCDGELTGADALDVLLVVAGDSELPLPSGCPPVGTALPAHGGLR